MSVLGTADAPLDIFGGLVTDMSPADLPAGASPDCADVAFQLGAVKTRPGLHSMYTPIAGNPTVNYLKTYIQPNLTQTLLALDSAGTLWGETHARNPDADRFGPRRRSAREIGHALWPRIHRHFRRQIRHRPSAAVRRHIFRSRQPGGAWRRPHVGGRRAGGIAGQYCRVAHRRGARERHRHDHHERGPRLPGRADRDCRRRHGHFIRRACSSSRRYPR